MDWSDLAAAFVDVPGRWQRRTPQPEPRGDASTGTRFAALLAGCLVLPAFPVIWGSWALASDTDALLSIVTGPVGLAGVIAGICLAVSGLVLARRLWSRRVGARYAGLAVGVVATFGGFMVLLSFGGTGGWARVLALTVLGYGLAMVAALLTREARADFPAG